MTYQHKRNIAYIAYQGTECIHCNKSSCYAKYCHDWWNSCKLSAAYTYSLEGHILSRYNPMLLAKDPVEVYITPATAPIR